MPSATPRHAGAKKLALVFLQLTDAEELAFGIAKPVLHNPSAKESVGLWCTNATIKHLQHTKNTSCSGSNSSSSSGGGSSSSSSIDYYSIIIVILRTAQMTA